MKGIRAMQHITFEEFKRVIEKMNKEVREDQKVLVKNGITLEHIWKSEYGKNMKDYVVISRDSKFEFTPNANIAKTICELIEETNLHIEKQDQISHDGEICSINALISLILIIEEEYTLEKVKKILSSIYTSYMEEVKEHEFILPKEFSDSVNWIRKMLQIKRWDIGKANESFNVHVYGSTEFPTIKIQSDEWECRYNRSWLEIEISIKVKERIDEDSLSDDFESEFIYKMNLRSAEEFLKIETEALSIDRFNIKTLMTYFSNKYGNQISEEDLEFGTKVLEKIIKKTDEVFAAYIIRK